MPELPEVEATRLHLEPALVGNRIRRVDVRRARMLRRQPHPADFAARLEGRRVVGLRRHGKFLLADVEGDFVWVTHLGMSGRLEIAAQNDAERPHTNVVVEVPGRQVRMVDPRTFGFVAVYTPDEYAASPLAMLGPDALDDLPRAPALQAALRGRSVAIKTLLLDQRFLAGIGNIYADEILHRAGVRGARPAGSLDRDEVGKLRAGVRPVLRAGLRHGGTSLDDLAYLLPDGRAGDYLERLRVYGREDEPCRRCGTPIRRSAIGGRSAYWCPTCQI